MTDVASNVYPFQTRLVVGLPVADVQTLIDESVATAFTPVEAELNGFQTLVAPSPLTIQQVYSGSTFNGSIKFGSDDPFSSPVGTRQEGSADYVRALTFGAYGAGVGRSLVITDQPIESSREGVNGGIENPPQMSAYPFFDSVADYVENDAKTPTLILSGVNYTATTIALTTAMSQAQQNKLRHTMFVLTNSNPQYGSWVTSWTPTTINVSGWYVLGSGNSSAGQVPSATLAAGETSRRVFFGAATNLFIRNDRITYNPTAMPDSQVKAIQWCEVNLSNLGPPGYLSVPGFTMALDGNAPRSDSYAIRATGPWPIGIQIDGITALQVKATGFQVDAVGQATVFGGAAVAPNFTGAQVAWGVTPGSALAELRNGRGTGSGGWAISTINPDGTTLGGVNIYGSGHIAPFTTNSQTIGLANALWANGFFNKLTTPNLANAANDAAAATAGVLVGEEYRNGSIKMVRVA